MLISKAYAQAMAPAVEMGETAATFGGADAPSAMEAFLWNMGMVGVLVILFYMLLIRPQQKRFREHSQMLTGLKKGDRVVTGGGLVGKIEKITEGDPEVIVDLGGGMKVTAVRSTLQSADTPLLKKAANQTDAKQAKKK